MHTAYRRVHSITQHLQAPAARRAVHASPTAATLASGFAAPQDALSMEPLSTPAETAARDNARQLLPFNYGRELDTVVRHVLQPVGHQTQRAVVSAAPVPALFRELRLTPRAAADLGPRVLKLKNRVVVSPMCTYSADDGFLNDFHLVHAGQYALGGAAMVILEASAVSPEGRISPVDAGIWKDGHIAPLARIAAFLRSQDCRAGIQLAHAGRKASGLPLPHAPRAPAKAKGVVGPEMGGWPQDIKGASALAFMPGATYTPHEMTLQEIGECTRQFAEAAVRVHKAGFEYAEIHAAHGYLLSSFLSPNSNKRTDDYGGSLANRSRFLLEVVSAVRAVYPGMLGVRLSCVEWVGAGGWGMSDTLALVDLLVPLGVDLVDCSSGGQNAAQVISPLVPGYQVQFAAAVKAKHPQLVVAAVGLITEPKHANEIVEKGDADLVLLAREFLRSPHWTMEAALALGYDMDWAPQYARAKPTSKIASIP